MYRVRLTVEDRKVEWVLSRESLRNGSVFTGLVTGSVIVIEGSRNTEEKGKNRT